MRKTLCLLLTMVLLLLSATALAETAPPDPADYPTGMNTNLLDFSLGYGIFANADQGATTSVDDEYERTVFTGDKTVDVTVLHEKNYGYLHAVYALDIPSSDAEKLTATISCLLCAAFDAQNGNDYMTTLGQADEITALWNAATWTVTPAGRSTSVPLFGNTLIVTYSQATDTWNVLYCAEEE